MKKRISLILCLLCISLYSGVSAETKIHAGTPKGFYDDIDPNNPNSDYNSQTDFGAYYNDDNGISSSEKNSNKDYASLYNSLEPADFSYLHGIDPDQYYDSKDAAWSVYPLFRLNSAIYFKNSTIEPGYYLLTPRENNGKWYMLFKQNGVVLHIIPVYERDYTPEAFYDKHIPKPKLTPSQKVHMGILSLVGKTKSSKRQEPVKTYLEVTDLENHFVSITVYYGNHKYSSIFRTIRL